jgi:hypothetical protein
VFCIFELGALELIGKGLNKLKDLNGPDPLHQSGSALVWPTRPPDQGYADSPWPWPKHQSCTPWAPATERPPHHSPGQVPVGLKTVITAHSFTTTHVRRPDSLPYPLDTLWRSKELLTHNNSCPALRLCSTATVPRQAAANQATRFLILFVPRQSPVSLLPFPASKRIRLIKPVKANK